MFHERTITQWNLRAPQGVTFAGGVLAIADTGNHRLTLVDPVNLASAALRFGVQGTSPNTEGLLFPSAAIFASSTEIFVADTQNRHVDRYVLANGAWAFSASFTPNMVGPAVGDLVDIALEASGILLLLDAENKRVLRLVVATGVWSVAVSDAQLVRPTALASGGGFIWVADSDRHQIARYDSNGLRSNIGSYGTAPGQIISPNGLAFAAGKIMIAEIGGGFSVFTSNGVFVERTKIAGGLHRLGRVTFDGVGKFYVADALSDAIHVLAPGQAPSGSATLSPQRLDFGPIGVGMRLAFEVRVKNSTALPVILETLTCAGGDFTIDPATMPILPATLAAGTEINLRVECQPTRPGIRASALRATFSGSSGSTAAFTNLFAVGATIDPFLLALVLDRSGSMAGMAGSMVKIERLRDSCSTLFDLLEQQTASEISISSFSNTSALNMGRQAISPQSLAACNTIVANLTPGGATAIGAGLQSAFAELTQSYIGRRIVIVLTDGMENVPPMIANVAVPANVRVFSLGLGDAAEIDVAKLRQLAASTTGYLQVTDGSEHLLPKFFTQIFADVAGQQFLLDPEFSPVTGSVYDFPIYLSDGEAEVTCLLNYEHDSSQFDMTLISPTGRALSGAGITLLRRRRHILLRARLRGVRGFRAGQWVLRVAAKKANKAERAVLNIVGRSDFVIDADLRVIAEGRRKANPPNGGEPDVLFSDYRATRQQKFTASNYVPTCNVGDSIVLRLSSQDPGLDFISGTVFTEQPTDSLAANAVKVDPDALDGMENREAIPKAPLIRRTIRRKIAYRHKDRAGVVQVPLLGPDGVYSIRYQCFFKTNRGQVLQRERTIQIFVEP